MTASHKDETKIKTGRQKQHYMQTQENTSRFQNKSSNPHSEFTRFDVHIFIYLQWLWHFCPKEMAKY